MNQKTTLLLLAGCGLAATTQGQDASPHHFGFGLPVWLNAHATFSAARATDPGPNDGSPYRNRNYDDGYNRVDSTGNATTPPAGSATAPPYSFPRTSYFGYASDNQAANSALPPTGGTLALHSFQINGGDYTSRLDNKPIPGIEFSYRYDVKQGRNWALGIESGLSYQYYKWEQNGPQNATVDLLTDTYALGGVTLPAGMAPYNGPFTAVPGSPLIGSTPTRTEGTVAAVVSGNRTLNLHALQWRLGPTLDWKPGARWELGVQTGVALGVGFSRLHFAESVAVADPTTPAAYRQNGDSSATHGWVGWFNAVRATCHLNGSWDAHVEVRNIQQNGFTHEGGIRSARINLADALAVVAGLGFQF